VLQKEMKSVFGSSLWLFDMQTYDQTCSGVTFSSNSKSKVLPDP